MKMEAKQQSNFGDWAFPGRRPGSGGWLLGYEGIDTINAWLATMQTATPTMNASMGAWLAANWGFPCCQQQ